MTECYDDSNKDALDLAGDQKAGPDQISTAEDPDSVCEELMSDSRLSLEALGISNEVRLAVIAALSEDNHDLLTSISPDENALICKWLSFGTDTNKLLMDVTKFSCGKRYNRENPYRRPISYKVLWSMREQMQLPEPILLGDIIQLTKEDLLKLDFFGKKGLKILEKGLAELGLTLGTKLPETTKKLLDLHRTKLNVTKEK